MTIDKLYKEQPGTKEPKKKNQYVCSEQWSFHQVSIKEEDTYILEINGLK